MGVENAAAAGGENQENLIDAGQAAAATAAANAAANGAAAAVQKPALAFSYDEKAFEQVFGKAGEDGRPANLADKYWNKDSKSVKGDVLFNQLRWAEGKIGKALPMLGAPPEGTEYTVTVAPELNVEIPADDPSVRGFFAIARKHDVSQAFVDEVIAEVAKNISGGTEATLNDELGKLGNGVTQRLKDMDDFLGATVSKEQATQIKGLLTSADAFEALEALVKKSAAPAFRSKDDDLAPEGADNLKAEWEKQYFAKNEQGERLVAIDPAYKRRVEVLAEKVFGTTRRDNQGRAVTG